LLNSGTGLEGLALTPAFDTVVLAGIQILAAEATEIEIANTTPFANTITATLFNTSGAMAGRFLTQVPPKGSFSTVLNQMFPNATAPFQGYILVQGSERLTASATTFAGNAIASIPGQSLYGTATSFYAAHFTAGTGQDARLDIVNTGSATAHVTLQFNKDDGTPLAQSITTTIGSGAQYWADLSMTLGLSAKQFSMASISVTSDQPGLVGDVTFGDTASITNYRTSIPLMPAQTAQAIPYVLNSSAYPMTLYAANTGTAKANVTLTLYAADGSTTGTTTTTIVAGGRLAQTLSALIPAAAGQTGGALEIDSDQPLSVAAMILPANPAADWAAIAAQPSSLVKPAGPTPLISTGGITSATASNVTIADYPPGVFSYARTATAHDPIIVHFSNNTLVSPSNPAVSGEIITIYATGIGKLSNAPADGAGAPGGPLAQAVDPPAITIGGVASGTFYFPGVTPGSEGLTQFDVTLPASLPSGSLPVVINFPSGDSSPVVNLAVQGNLAGSPQLSVGASRVPIQEVIPPKP
jgi:uncharacterized protein (TIGR03437 family)